MKENYDIFHGREIFERGECFVRKDLKDRKLYSSLDLNESYRLICEDLKKGKKISFENNFERKENLFFISDLKKALKILSREIGLEHEALLLEKSESIVKQYLSCRKFESFRKEEMDFLRSKFYRDPSVIAFEDPFKKL